MRMVEKLIKRLHRIFDRSPDPFLAMRIGYFGDDMSWRVKDGFLTTTVTGGTGSDLSIDLGQYTLGELEDYIAAQPGYEVRTSPPSDSAQLSARILLDGGKSILSSNGDQIFGFAALEWAYEDAVGVELAEASRQVDNALLQMNIKTARQYWLDYIGEIYGFPRLLGEPDELYGPRIIYEVLAPRDNNRAIEMAISRATGGQEAEVVTVTEPGDLFPVHDGEIDYDGQFTYSTTGKPVRNLFDVLYSFDLEGSEDVGPFQERVLELIDRFRAAGNHLRQILLQGSQLIDDANIEPTDSQTFQAEPQLVDDGIMPASEANSFATNLGLSADAVSESDDTGGEINILSAHTYSGVHDYGATGRTIYYNSGESVTEPF